MDFKVGSSLILPYLSYVSFISLSIKVSIIPSLSPSSNILFKVCFYLK
jgi:hypothetical protein